jgi:hypothetical protein
MKLLKIGTTDFLSSVILSIPNMIRRIIIMVTNRNLILFFSGVIVFVVGYNLGVVIQDVKMLSSSPQSQDIEYKQIPVIPYAE